MGKRECCRAGAKLRRCSGEGPIFIISAGTERSMSRGVRGTVTNASVRQPTDVF